MNRRCWSALLNFVTLYI